MSINFNIDIDKYKILKNINQDYLPHVLDEIFGIGFNVWIKNYIRNDIVLSETQNNITESKLSSSKGQHGENIVIDLIIDRFKDIQVENTSKIPHHGDIQLTLQNNQKIIVEVKNYNNTINQEQIDKLKFDMKFCSINYAIFISLNSGIVGKKRFELETFYHNKSNYYILYLPYSMHKTIPNRKYIITHNSYDESIFNLSTKVEFSLCILQSISDSIIKFNCTSVFNTDFDYLINELNCFFDEFKSVKNSCYKLEDNIKKNIESHLSIIKEYEFNIKNKINNLIVKKLNKKNIGRYYQKDKIIIKNTDNDWDIFYCENIIGKITWFPCSDNYDLVIYNSKYFINEFFNTFDECVEFIDKL